MKWPRGPILRSARVALVVVLFLVSLPVVMAIGRPETGPFEKVVLAGIVMALAAFARPVHRIG